MVRRFVGVLHSQLARFVLSAQIQAFPSSLKILIFLSVKLVSFLGDIVLFYRLGPLLDLAKMFLYLREPLLLILSGASPVLFSLQIPL